ncbi:uncharacterized protein LOC133289882 [Gastrolobium bilobum]|uniref:uncharacterized protein LOC133289882 n=1 Tax=Gastrolobium bilobum TaxID=150636 RepID=UPI002AB07856|nr:uncharacterized protein LOC133289882 [Gastrolobium bilobum]
MAETSSSSRKSKECLITELEDMDAAQQLMQLSDEENNNNNNNIVISRKRSRSMDEEEVDQRTSNDTIMAKIQEIFGKDIEVFTPKKQRRYRSLVNIYMETSPINAGNDRRVSA